MSRLSQVKGKMPHKLIRKGVFSELHFDPDYDFLFKERDKVPSYPYVTVMSTCPSLWLHADPTW